MMNKNQFDDWFHSLEVFHLLSERFWDDVDRGDRDSVVEWMNASFYAGYQAAQNDNDSFGGTD